MPTYQYACTECGHGFETVQSFSEDALTECPQCTGRLRKVFNSVGIVFKGSGFYRTDSREKPKDDAAKSSKDGASTGAGDTKKADSSSGAAASGGSSSVGGVVGVVVGLVVGQVIVVGLVVVRVHPVRRVRPARPVPVRPARPRRPAAPPDARPAVRRKRVSLCQFADRRRPGSG